MKILLDTNIFIYRESHNNVTDTVAKLFLWFDKLKYSKVVSPITKKEIEGYSSDSEKDKRIRESLLLKFTTYPQIIPEELTDDYNEKIKSAFPSSGQRSDYDNQLLYQVYKKVAGIDVMLTNDNGIIRKAEFLGIRNKVLTPSELLYKIEKENPEKIDYRMLAIKKTKFGKVCLKDVLFDSLRKDYHGFEEWFKSKNAEDCYCLKDEKGKLKGFLYIKVEHTDEDYRTFDPVFAMKKRIKIGTFKIESTGFRAGERFLKIIFKNAKLYDVDEIYVTMFDKRKELKDFFTKWGFKRWGTKTDTGELIYVKDMRDYDDTLTPQQNTPLIKSNVNYFILPIEPEYHTDLFPDSILTKEDEHLYTENFAHRYALSKVYITGSPNFGLAHPGDIVLIYRRGESYPKNYSSCITTTCVLHEIIAPRTKEDFLKECANRTVFGEGKLSDSWESGRHRTIIKMVEHENLSKKVILLKLLDIGLTYQDLRPFTKITKEQFESIMLLSN